MDCSNFGTRFGRFLFFIFFLSSLCSCIGGDKPLTIEIKVAEKPGDFYQPKGMNLEMPFSDCEIEEISNQLLADGSYRQNMIQDVFKPIKIELDLSDPAFENRVNSKYQRYSSFDFKIMFSLANSVADQVAENFDELGIECNSQQTCVEGFLLKIGTRALREPVSEAQAKEWVAQLGYEGIDQKELLKQAVRLILLDPHTTYHFQKGIPWDENTIALTALDRAALLAKTLWNSIPDDELLETAGSGALNLEMEYKAQVDRMLEHPHFFRAYGDFHKNLVAGSYYSGDKDSSIRKAALREIEYLSNKLVAEGGSFSDLFTSNKTFVNAELAKIYDLPLANLNPEGWVELELENRAGILTRAAFLVDGSKYKSITHRGIRVIDNFLCYDVPPPPAEVQDLIPEIPRDDKSTNRQRYEKIISSNNACDGCHFLMGPIGIALENFDVDGKYQTQENGLLIDSLVDNSLLGMLDGYQGLSNAMASSDKALQCYSASWYEKSVNPKQNNIKASCEKESFANKVMENKGNLKKMLKELVLNPAFFVRKIEGVEL